MFICIFFVFVLPKDDFIEAIALEEWEMAHLNRNYKL